jgi:predicted ATPase
MIIVNKIDPPTVELFDPEGYSMGFVNEYEFNDIRIQIKNTKAEGYHCVFKGELIKIDKNGKVDNWPSGFFDLIESQLIKLI